MPEVIAALRLMKAQGAELCIISDANTFYIDTILKASGLRASLIMLLMLFHVAFCLRVVFHFFFFHND